MPVRSNTTSAPQQEVHERSWEPHNLSIKEIRSAVPDHLFERSALRSSLYIVHDVILISIFVYLSTYIKYLPGPLQYVAWFVYALTAGTAATGLWVIAHECGHQSFSSSKKINDAVGLVLHSLLLVPYHSWRISHSRHHKYTGNMAKDEVFVPRTRSELGIPHGNKDDGHREAPDAPILDLLTIIEMWFIGFPAYLIGNISGQNYKRWTSHYHTFSPIFQTRDFWDVIISDIALAVVISGIFYATYLTSAVTVLKYYFMPWVVVNSWLTSITYLQHTHPDMPHYSEKVWNFQRGAALTVDRSCGKIIDHCLHHITDSHVAHHFFSLMPHYNAVEATKHIQQTLGKHYIKDDMNFLKALWVSTRQCKFVEDDTDVKFWRK